MTLTAAACGDAQEVAANVTLLGPAIARGPGWWVDYPDLCSAATALWWTDQTVV